MWYEHMYHPDIIFETLNLFNILIKKLRNFFQMKKNSEEFGEIFMQLNGKILLLYFSYNWVTKSVEYLTVDFLTVTTSRPSDMSDHWELGFDNFIVEHHVQYPFDWKSFIFTGPDSMKTYPKIESLSEVSLHYSSDFSHTFLPLRRCDTDTWLY